jgi:hypothetical protein
MNINQAKRATKAQLLDELLNERSKALALRQSMATVIGDLRTMAHQSPSRREELALLYCAKRLEEKY